MPLTSRGVVGLGSLNFKISSTRAILIKAIRYRPLSPDIAETHFRSSDKMSDESVNLKAASEAAVAKFQLERVLNQGTLPTS